RRPPGCARRARGGAGGGRGRALRRRGRPSDDAHLRSGIEWRYRLMDNYEVPPHIDLPYGYMEREIKFKLLAAHAMVDREFFEHLREDPDGAAAELHIRLSVNDLIYLREL